MAPRVERISTHRFRARDRLILDTNIWIYVENPGDPRDRRTAIYSQALKAIRQAGSRIYIHEIILSELVNVLTHQEFHRAGLDRKKWDLRKFQKSAQFQAAAVGIANLLRGIIDRCEVAHVKIAKPQLANILQKFATSRCHVNDLLIAEVCRSGDFTLVTHDAGFCDQRFRLLTENEKLLR